MSLSIRKAMASDIPHLGPLIAESVRRLSEGYYSTEEAERALVRVFGVDSQLVEDGTYYVAERDGELAGCGGWSKRATLFGGDQTKQGEDAELRPGAAPARIRAFFVHPSHARRGIGTRLLEVCESAARGHGFTEAELVATLPGVPLYEALGYEAVEPITVDLEDGYVLRCIRMRKGLADPEGIERGSGEHSMKNSM
jgi:GNAT superfamily N-acetyltransferase